MTRLAVLSDIHGNLPALQVVIRDMEAFNVDHVVCAGDNVNWGPFSRQVMEIITAKHWAIIRGNNEYYPLDFQTNRAPAHWSDFRIPPVLMEQLGAHWLNVIASMPDTRSLRFRDAPPIRVVHGIPDNPWKPIYPDTSDDDIRDYLKDMPESTPHLWTHSSTHAPPCGRLAHLQSGVSRNPTRWRPYCQLHDPRRRHKRLDTTRASSYTFPIYTYLRSLQATTLCRTLWD